MLLTVLTPWHLLWLLTPGLFVTLLFYLAYRIAPTKQPPEYILGLTRDQLLVAGETQAAEKAIEQLVESVPEVGHQVSTRTKIDDDLRLRYNAYKRQCIGNRTEPKGLGAWVYSFDPDLYQRVYGSKAPAK